MGDSAKPDPFDALKACALGDVAIHNVRLADVQAADDGRERLTVEREGVVAQLPGGGRWSDEGSRRDVGQVGYLVRAKDLQSGVLPVGACYFYAYLDQGLRRASDLDASGAAAGEDGRVRNVVGWRYNGHPFRAPVGLIPGQGGAFVPDGTVPVTLRVPPEFVRECHAVQRTPEEVLRGFIADLAGLMNYVANPRADGYSSNGSDERQCAADWLERAYGIDRIDLERIEQDEADSEANRDELSGLFDDFLDGGGTADEFLEAVRQLVPRARASDGE